MATESQLIEALRAADSAGNTEDAQAIAALIKQQRASVTPIAKKQKPQGEIPVTAGDVARSTLQGGTFGFSDELGAGIAAAAAKAAQAVGAIPGDETYMQIYSQMQKQVSDQQKAFGQAHPGIDIPAQLVGGLATGGGAMKGATTLPQIMGRGALTGAGYGAAYGAGTADQGLGNRAKGAAIGGTIGAVAGAALPVAMTATGRVGGSAIQKAKEALGSKAAAGVKDFAEAMTDDEAAAIVGEIAQRTGMSADDIAEKMGKLGEKATLADVDENFAYALHDAISRFSPAKGSVRKEYAERLLGEHSDTLRALSSNFDNYTADDVYSALEKSAKERSRIAGPLYEKAFKSGIPEDLSKNPVFGIPNVQDALKQANRMAALDTERVTRTAAGEMKTGKLNPVERIHYAKSILWDQAESLRRTGENSKARLIDGQRKEIDKVLNQIPEYAQARKIWSSSMEADNAAQIGKDIFKLNSREFSEALSSMNPHEREMAKMGALSSAAEKIEGVADNRSVSRKLIENESMRKKVEALFGSKKEIDSLMENADKWDAFRGTNRIISQQSKTRELTKAGEEINSIMDAVSQSAKQKVIELIKGERLTAQRANAVAKILSKEGMTKADIERLVAINRKLFMPGKTTESVTKLATREAIKPVQQMYSDKKSLNDYMR